MGKLRKLISAFMLFAWQYKKAKSRCSTSSHKRTCQDGMKFVAQPHENSKDENARNHPGDLPAGQWGSFLVVAHTLVVRLPSVAQL
jgi:hypothetical protein